MVLYTIRRSAVPKNKYSTTINIHSTCLVKEWNASSFLRVWLIKSGLIFAQNIFHGFRALSFTKFNYCKMSLKLSSVKLNPCEK